MGIRKGNVNDKDAVEELYISAKKTMHELNINQWSDQYPTGNDFLNDVKDGHGLVYEKNGIVVGVACCYVGHDSMYDEISNGSWIKETDKYGIIHRLAVNPDFRNEGIASSFVEYVKKLCIKEGAISMRCDTHFDNKIMQNFFIKNGYERRGIISFKPFYTGIAYEKIL